MVEFTYLVFTRMPCGNYTVGDSGFCSCDVFRALINSLVSEFRVKITFSYSELHDKTNSVTEIPEVGMQLPEWRATLH